MHFGENQLSQSLIGLSPLTTGHPLHFQLKWVRASTRSYTRFTLPMARSLRFGSRTRDSHSPYSDSLSLRLPHNGLTSPRTANSQAHSSKGTPSQLQIGRASCRYRMCIKIVTTALATRDSTWYLVSV